jgi:hypothetical protein
VTRLSPGVYDVSYFSWCHSAWLLPSLLVVVGLCIGHAASWCGCRSQDRTLICSGAPKCVSGCSKSIGGAHQSTPLRQPELDLHRRQMRSPAQALENGVQQMRHFLIFGSIMRSGSGPSCPPPTALPCSSEGVPLESCKEFAPSLRFTSPNNLLMGQCYDREKVDNATSRRVRAKGA